MSQPDAPLPQTVTRVARRRAKAQCENAYEALLRGMIDEMRAFPGFVGAKVVPPATPGEEYQVITEFATQADLERWDTSQAHLTWLARLQPVAEGAPDYRVITGLEAWFTAAIVPASVKPPRWRMTVASWVGIFPTVLFFQWVATPLLDPVPYLPRIAIFTALVAVSMAYIVMPVVARALKPWLMAKS